MKTVVIFDNAPPMPNALTDCEVRHIIDGLRMRRNYIETGDVTLSAKDVESWDDETRKVNERRGVRVQALSVDQMRLIVALDDLAKKLGGSTL